MTTTQRAAANLSTAIEHVIVSRPARIPSDIALIDSLASLSFNPAVKVERLNRMDHIARLIDSALVKAGR
jgi:hypothetical protein